jgi:TRAP-type mannitol/chloroaromatic compound transport system substrate-binding protein
VAIRELASQGAQLRPFSQEIMEAAFVAAQETYDELNAQNANFKKIYDALVAYRRDAYLYWQIPEYTYDTFMMIQQRNGKL